MVNYLSSILLAINDIYLKSGSYSDSPIKHHIGISLSNFSKYITYISSKLTLAKISDFITVEF